MEVIFMIMLVIAAAIGGATWRMDQKLAQINANLEQIASALRSKS